MNEWAIDSHKLHLHPARVAQWLEADTWEKAKKVYPIYWEITSSAACNHRCTFCSVDAIGYPAIVFGTDILIDRLVEAKRLGVKSVMFAGTGEPLLHKRISEVTRRACHEGLDVAFTTNGVLLDKLECVDLCTWIKVSMNAGRAETYAKVHKTKDTDWGKVWRNIRSAVARKGNCTLGVQCVILPENVYEMRDLAALCIDAGVDYLVLKPYTQATFQLSHRYEGIEYSEIAAYLHGVKEFSNDRFKVIYREHAVSQEIAKVHAYDKCRATPNFWTYAMADGRMFTCSAHLLDERFCIGNLNLQSFQEIWEGEKRRENWELMRSFDIGLCRLNCRMDNANKYLADFSRTEHINFI